MPKTKPTPVKGVLSQPSDFGVKETMDRLVIFLQQQDITIYARINRQVELRWFDRHIRPFEYILCGNPQAAGPVIENNPLTALDFPLRIIAWEDEHTKCWVAYKNPEFLANIYSVPLEVTIWLDLEKIIFRALSF